MSLPDAWVDRIFLKMTLVYGHQFLSRWDGMPIELVKADWGKELSAYQQNPGAIAHALEHLPTAKPPTVLEFRDICRRAPQLRNADESLQIGHSGKPVDPELVRQAIGEIRAKPATSSSRRWAERMQERDKARPQGVTPTMRRMYRTALGLDATT